MIKHVRQFIARIVDTRVSEAVIDLHRSMQHLEINNDERHKVVLNCLDKLDAKVQLSGDNAHNATIAVREYIDLRTTESERVIIQKLGSLRDQAHDNQAAIRDAITDNIDRIQGVISERRPGQPKPPVPPAPGTKKPFVGRELKNENLKNSKEWEALSEPARAHFVAMVKDRFKDIEMQGYYEAECFRQYLPVTVLLSDMLRRAANYTEAECL